MEQSEAVSLLTRGVIDISQLSQEGMSLLDELCTLVVTASLPYKRS